MVQTTNGSVLHALRRLTEVPQDDENYCLTGNDVSTNSIAHFHDESDNFDDIEFIVLILQGEFLNMIGQVR